jgi:SAM-dependent methyltransferase
VLDISRHAARYAVRAHPRADAVVADAWQPLPVVTGAAAVVLNVFAPRNGAELRRVLRPGGSLLVVTPTPDHLRELVGPLGLLTVDPRKRERVADQLDRHFAWQAEERHERVLRLSRDAVGALVGMGPSARHRDPAAVAAVVQELPERCTVTASFRTVTYRARG